MDKLWIISKPEYSSKPNTISFPDLFQLKENFFHRKLLGYQADSSSISEKGIVLFHRESDSVIILETGTRIEFINYSDDLLEVRIESKKFHYIDISKYVDNANKSKIDLDSTLVDKVWYVPSSPELKFVLGGEFLSSNSDILKFKSLLIIRSIMIPISDEERKILHLRSYFAGWSIDFFNGCAFLTFSMGFSNSPFPLKIPEEKLPSMFFTPTSEPSIYLISEIQPRQISLIEVNSFDDDFNFLFKRK